MGLVLVVIAAALRWPIVERRTPRSGPPPGLAQWLILRPYDVRAALTSAREHPRLALGGVIGIVAVLPVGNDINGALGDVLASLRS